MAQEGYAHNTFGNKMLGDLCIVHIRIGAGAGAAALVAAVSSPNCTASNSGAGVYVVTFPTSTSLAVLGREVINRAGNVEAAISGYVEGTGSMTLTLSDATQLTGTEQIHLTFLSGAA